MNYKLPFTIGGKYQSELTYEEFIELLNEKAKEKYFLGAKVDKYAFEVKDKTITIARYALGLDVFLESFPLIKMEIKNTQPLIADVKFLPNYFSIFIFSILIVAFSYGTIFVKD